METCFKDIDLIKKRMVNPNYRDDPNFMNYFHWYSRVLKNIRKFVRRILYNIPSKTVAKQETPEDGAPTTQF